MFNKRPINAVYEVRARKYFEPDILVKEGDELKLGNTAIRFMETPGHTRGTISLFFDTREGAKFIASVPSGARARIRLPAGISSTRAAARITDARSTGCAVSALTFL